MKKRFLAALLTFVVMLGVDGVQTGDAAAASDVLNKEARDGLFMDVEDNNNNGFTLNSFADDVLQCNPRGNSIFSSGENVGECLKRRAVTHLLGLSTSASTVGVTDGISFVTTGDAARALPPHWHYGGGEAPGLGEAMRHFLGMRTMRWTLDTLYPGLVMRVGPIGYQDQGVLEFVLERLYDDTDRSIGPAKLLMKRTLLPALLGFKLKLSTLMPILLAGFFFMASKAVFFSKLAILIGASIGLKTLLFGGHLHGAGGGHLGAYGLHPVGHSSDNLWDSLFGHQVGHHNPYGPVSFKSSVRAAPPEVLDPANDNVPRTLPTPERREAPTPAAPGQQRATSGKRNFSWEPAKSN